MKRITLANIRTRAGDDEHEVTIDPAVAAPARRAVERMLCSGAALSRKGPRDDRPAAAASMIEPLVRAALLEDLGRAGDITTDAIVAGRQRRETALVARKAGIVAGLDFALLAFRLIDPRDRAVAVARADGSRVAPATSSPRSRPDARHPDGRTGGAEFPVPSLGHRLGHGGDRRRGRRHKRAGRLHAQDPAGPARGGEIRGARRRRLQSPLRPRRRAC